MATTLTPSDAIVTCPVCDAPAEGVFCSECGSRTRARPLGLKEFVREGSKDLALLERRLVRTLPTLLLEPGRITLDYSEGRGALYVHPLRLYFALALLYFGVLGLVGVSRYHLGVVFADTGQEGTLLEWIPRVVLAGVPILALFLMLAFRRSGRTYVENLTLSLHFHGLLFVVSTPVSLLEHWLGSTHVVSGLVVLAMQIGATAWLTIATRRIHATSGRRALGGTLLASVGYVAFMTVLALATAPLI